MQKLDISRVGDGKLFFHSRPVNVEVRKSDRKSIGITITPEMDVIFRVPLATSNAELMEYANRRKVWIAKQLGFFEQYHPKRTKRNFLPGETFHYLGREYRLKIEVGISGVVLTNEYLIVSVSDISKQPDIGNIVRSWYKERAEEVFRERHQALKEDHEKHLGYWIDFKGVRKLRSKWGEYNQTEASYTLNIDLVMAHIRLIDYVILHEVMHHKHLNHGRGFFSTLEKVMPDWKKWKEKMEVMLA